MISRSNFVRHVFTCELRKSARTSDFHFFVDRTGTYIERAAEDVREAKYVIDLVRIVRTAGRNNRVAAHFTNFFRADFRIRVRHSEDDRVCRHGLDHVFVDRALNRQAEETVSAFHGFSQCALVRLNREAGLELVHAFLTALVDHAVAVTHQNVLSLHTEMANKTCAGQTRRARA